jgi:hypothetical protein
MATCYDYIDEIEKLKVEIRASKGQSKRVTTAQGTNFLNV